MTTLLEQTPQCRTRDSNGVQCERDDHPEDPDAHACPAAMAAHRARKRIPALIMWLPR